MNEYEAATLALRESALWVAVAQVVATVVIGCGQIAVVWFGIRAMQTAGDRRARGQDQRHAEAMRRQDQHHAEAMRRQDQHHAEAMVALAAQGRALEAQTRALETLIERTAPPGKNASGP